MAIKLSKIVIFNLYFRLSDIGIIQIWKCSKTFNIYIFTFFFSEIIDIDTQKNGSKFGHFYIKKRHRCPIFNLIFKIGRIRNFQIRNFYMKI